MFNYLKSLRAYLTVTWCCLISLTGFAYTSKAPTDTKISDNYSSLGIDKTNPHFAWVLHDTQRDQFQTAYQITVITDKSNLAKGGMIVWNSGKVRSDQQYGVTYEGIPLKSLSKYWWKVRTWNKNGELSPWSKPVSFVIGFLTESDWDRNANWIGYSKSITSEADTLPMFRKEFSVRKKIRNAWLSISGLGQFNCFLNGVKIGNHVMDPAWTDYDKTISYVMFDLTDSLKRGDNVIGVMLGKGLYANKGMRHFGALKLIAELHIEFADGSFTNIVSDTTWKVKRSPFTRATFDGSENYDARLLVKDWDLPGIKTENWDNAAIEPAPEGRMTAQSAPPVISWKRFKPVRVTNPAPGVVVYDFGQNMNGQFSFTVNGLSGAVVKVMPGEDTTAHGVALKGRTNGCLYTLDGEKDEKWGLSFSSIGFRYLEFDVVSNSASNTLAPRVNDISADFICTASTQIGSFSASDNRYNKIFDMVLNTLRSNLISVHTDGPNYERLAWQEVTYTLLPSSSYYFDLENLFKKIVNHTRDAQRISGLSPNIAPNYWKTQNDSPGYVFDDAPAWGASMIQLPWQVYNIYGDSTILRSTYENMRRYLAYLKSRENKKGVVSYGLGDWMAPGGGAVANIEGAVYVEDTRIVSQVARTLKTSDTAFYSAEYERVKKAYNSSYYNVASKTYLPVSQSTLALPLSFNIVPQTDRVQVAENLVKDIAEPQESSNPVSYGKKGEFGPVLPFHVTTGDIGTTFLWRALGEFGQADLVQKMIMQPTAPSYFSLLGLGCTTLPENWDYAKTRSHNHDMYAGIFEWFFRTLGGISPLMPGYREILLKPSFPKGLDSISVSTNTVRGLVSSSWKVTGAHTRWHIKIPVNATAMIYLPYTKNQMITESGKIIRKNNKAGAKVAGMNFKFLEKDSLSGLTYTVWDAGSGEYDLKW